MTALEGFNSLAPYYDTLKRFVFGTSITESEAYFLSMLPPKGNILILGGGSGDVLISLLRIRPQVTIWFVEASSKMISLAREKVAAPNLSQVRFIHGTQLSLPAGVLFDGVITNFFLDLFPERDVLAISQIIGKQIKQEGVWLVAEFHDGGRWWQKALLGVMYPFFALTCKIQARRLPRWEERLGDAGFASLSTKAFFGGFIKSSAYQKARA